MKEIRTNSDADRFQAEATRYATYLKTPEGRLRVDLAFANLRESLTSDTESMHALDLGGGTGAMSVRLARLGVHVTLLDSSLPMLDFAERSARDADVANRIVLKHGDVAQLTTLSPSVSFDVIVCHNVLEFVEDPVAVLSSAACILRKSTGIISILVRNQPGEVLKAALLNADLVAAECNLSAEWGDEALYGGRVRLFSAGRLHSMLKEASLTVTATCGVRVLSDYLPAKISRDDEYERIFELERKLGRRTEFAPIARYTQCIARRTETVTKDGQ